MHTAAHLRPLAKSDKPSRLLVGKLTPLSAPSNKFGGYENFEPPATASFSTGPRPPHATPLPVFPLFLIPRLTRFAVRSAKFQISPKSAISFSLAAPEGSGRGGDRDPLLLLLLRPACSQISPGMGFVSFVGRVLFASVFLLSAYQEFNEFGADGGPAAKSFKPKFDLVAGHAHTHLGFQVPEIEIKDIIAGTIALKGLGGLLFIFGSSLGATLLALYLALVTPIVYDFYNHDIEKPEFVQLFVKFTQSLALFGALLFFLGMKDSPKRAAKKKAPKAKTN
ncbi:hypothetical protein Taro_053094 [Colocasia esculenta]|uniref:Uncharacterized protein n=1 Tax=Colocasia esculenta TaxID=4460 RepID=A0A843XKA2_COLES|nr:hypothetical protein [Colocasia esculenta]